MTLLRPAILLHAALATAAFVISLASAVRWDGAVQHESDAAPQPAALAMYSSDAIEHGEAVYRTRRYAEAEDALRCAGLRNVAPTRGSRVLVPGKDYEVVPHPAARYAAEVDLPSHGNGAGLCAHLQQATVHQWYREHFRP